MEYKFVYEQLPSKDITERYSSVGLPQSELVDMIVEDFQLVSDRLTKKLTEQEKDNWEVVSHATTNINGLQFISVLLRK